MEIKFGGSVGRLTNHHCKYLACHENIKQDLGRECIICNIKEDILLEIMNLYECISVY
jgi:hypothetical protein